MFNILIGIAIGIVFYPVLTALIKRLTKSAKK